MNKAYKLRIYPNNNQKTLIDTTISCSRFIYNYFLDKRITNYKENKLSSTFFKDNKILTTVKNELVWLKNVDKFALQTSLKDLDRAYKNFFTLGRGFPNFKSVKKSKLSYKTCFTNNNIELKDNKIKLPKLKWIRFRDKRNLSNITKIINVSISKTRSGKYYASVCVEESDIILKKPTNKIGIDLGLKEFLTTSNGDFIENPRWLRNSEIKLKKLHKSFSQKKRGSFNREKARIKLAKQYEKISNQRRYFQQRLSTKLINENQVICVETLKSSNMIKNHKLAKSISDVSWFEFVRQLEYKSEWHKIDFVKIGQFYPSSQLCSKCNAINKKTKDLSYRTYICDSCGLEIDRDVNASINILNEGLRMLA